MGGEGCAQTSQCSKYVRRTALLLTLNECIHYKNFISNLGSGSIVFFLKQRGFQS